MPCLGHNCTSKATDFGWAGAGAELGWSGAWLSCASASASVSKGGVTTEAAGRNVPFKLEPG